MAALALLFAKYKLDEPSLISSVSFPDKSNPPPPATPSILNLSESSLYVTVMLVPPISKAAILSSILSFVRYKFVLPSEKKS